MEVWSSDTSKPCGRLTARERKVLGRRSTILLNSAVPEFPERTEMITAILGNNVQTVRKLIMNQEQLNVTDQEGRTYLHLAAYFDKVEISDLLIKAGIKVDSRDEHFLTPLHSACFNNSLNTVKLLIDRGADLSSRDRDWLTPLHICAATEARSCLLHLIKNVACLEIADQNGATALHYASANGFKRIAVPLLSAGANAKLQDKNGRTCLHYAVLRSDVQMVQLLLNHKVDVNVKDTSGLTALHVACTTSNSQIVELLIRFGANINEPDNYGNAPLHYVCMKNKNIACFDFTDERKALCNLLLNNGADLQAKNNLLLTPLHMIYEDSPVLDAYIRQGLDLDCRDYLGRTPFHVACFKGHNYLIDELVRNSADIRARDKFNRTPLHYAVEYSQYTPVSYLIRKDPSLIGLVDDNNCNSLHYAAKIGNPGIWGKLVEVYSDFSQKDNFGRTVHFYAAHSKKLLKYCMPLPSCLDSYNRNLLFYTLSGENSICSSNALDWLLGIQNLKIDVNQRDTFGRTPLHYAYLLKLELHVDILLKHFASLYIEDENGLMPIHYLILTDNHEALTALVDAGQIDLNQSRYKVCLLQCAAYNGANYCLKTLFRSNYKSYTSLSKALELACWNQHVACVETILSQMVRTHSIGDLYRSSALHIAALRSDFTCFNRLLVNLEKCDIRDERGRTTMMFALVNCKEKNYCIDSLLKRADCDLNAVDNEHRNVLFYSVFYENLEMVKLFLQSGVNALQRCSFGKTVLHLAATLSNTEIFACLVENLKQNHISYEQLTDNDGFNPLHYACYNGNTEIVRLLISAFPEKNTLVHSAKRISYLHLAVYAGNEDCVRLILDQFGRAIVNQVDSKGRNALHYLCMSRSQPPTNAADASANPDTTGPNPQVDDLSTSSNRMETSLDESQLPVDLPADLEVNKKQLAVYKLLINSQININCADKFGKTPLMIALQNECCRLSLCLIDEPTLELQSRDQNGRTALHYAAQFRHELAGQKLIRKDASLVNLADSSGRTALHISASSGQFELTKSLLTAGASCFVQDSDGFKPALACAKNNDVADCLNLIIDVMIYDWHHFEKSDTPNLSHSLADKESIRCSSPILETRKSLISQRSRVSSNLEEDLQSKHSRKSSNIG